MWKILLSILVVYLLYYSGIILYDLFLKKEKEQNSDDYQEFSLASLSDSDNVEINNIKIEDVENMKMPESFTKSEIVPSYELPIENEREDLNTLRQRFEAEETLDIYLEQSNGSRFFEEAEKHMQSSLEMSFQSENFKNNKKDKSVNWKELMNSAMTRVQMVENYEGQKVYNIVT